MKDEEQEATTYLQTEEEEIVKINKMAVKFQRRFIERFVELCEAVQDLEDGPKKRRLLGILNYIAGKQTGKV